MSYQQSGIDRHTYYQLINQVYHITNDERQKQNLSPLNLNHKLCQAAQHHSEDMAARNFFSHQSPDNKTPADRVNVTGYQWTLVAENISAGHASAWEVVQGWMDSPGHRANILTPNLQDIGVGVCYVARDANSVKPPYFWTQLFAKPK